VIYADTVQFVQEECCTCHMVWMMTKAFHQAMQDTGAFFHCPAGHSQHYTKTTLQKKQEELERSNREAASLRERAIGAERAKEKAERALKRHKKRAAAGLCPCCNRTVHQLADHMKSKHSDYLQLQGLAAPKQLTEKTQ
jgi:hypothetical protein